MDNPESPQNLYAKNLQQPFGYPLRFPEPKPGLPPSYAEHGLHIGDVGYVDDVGIFHVLFNICSSPDHELHQDQPNLASLVGLTNFNLKTSLPVPNAFPPNHEIRHGIPNPLGEGSERIQRFVSSSTPGAILSLPSGALYQHLRMDEKDEWHKLAEKYARRWCQFAKAKSLYLVTGFYKTSSWRLASYHDITGWDYRESGENCNGNQTVLILGFKMALRHLDNHPIILDLPMRPRSIWFKLWNMFILPFSVCWGLVVSIIARAYYVEHVPALSQPFHPSDMINRWLLDKNTNLDVAITHDSQWLSMLKEDDISSEIMVDEGRFRAFLDESYTVEHSSTDAGYLLRKSINNLHMSIPPPKRFFMPIVPLNTRQFITIVRVENVVGSMKRPPVGFYVVVQFNDIKRRSKCKPVSLSDGIVEWDHQDSVRPSDLTVEVRISVIASFEFAPLLGDGELLCEFTTGVSNLAKTNGTYRFASLGTREDGSSRPSLLVTLETRRFDRSYDWGYGNDQSERDEPEFSQVAEETDKGHDALARFRRDEGNEQLNQAVKWFQCALEHCYADHECYAAALFNLATAMFIHCQVFKITTDLDASIKYYRDALQLRPEGHPDRPRTVLHLAQALLYRQGKLGLETHLADEIQKFADEIRQICSDGDYDLRAANLMVDTLKRYQVLASKTLAGLDELVLELDRSVQVSPDWYVDRPYRLINLGVALRKRFEISGIFEDLRKSISAMTEASQLMPDHHFDRPWVVAFLGDSFHMRYLRRGDAADRDNSVSMIQDAMKLALDYRSLDMPWVIATFGQSLRICFAHGNDDFDLNSPISIIERAELGAGSNGDKFRMLAALGNLHSFSAHVIDGGDVSDFDYVVFVIENAVKLERSLTRPLETCFGDPSDLTGKLDLMNQRLITVGRLSVVRRCKSYEQGEEVALKIFTPTFKQKWVHELRIWRRLKHPNIVPLLGTASRAHDTFLVSALMINGTLFKYIEQRRAKLSSRDCVELVKGSAAGLGYPHSLGIVHGNLHPANILIDGKHNACLVGFGSSRTVSRFPDELADLHTNVDLSVPAMLWTAPERLFPSLYQELDPEFKFRATLQSDIYSLSSVILFILSGKYPWEEEDKAERELKKFRNPPRPAQPGVMPDSVWNFIEQCWSPREPKNRPSAKEVLLFCTHNLEQLWRSTVNVVLFGARHPAHGTGSIINLLLGEPVVFVSSGAERARRPRWYQLSIDEREYRLWDTIGCSPSQKPHSDFLFYERAHTLLRNIPDGVNLILLCADKRKFPSLLGHLYWIIRDFFYNSNVPIGLVITHCDPPEEDWWERHEHEITRQTTIPIRSIPHACVTTNPTGHNHSQHALKLLLLTSAVAEPIPLRPDLPCKGKIPSNLAKYSRLDDAQVMALAENFRDSARPPFNVVLFGAVDADVGSIVSLITGHPVAEVGSRRRPCSYRSWRISTGQKFRIWDVVGINDIDKDTCTQTLQNASQFIHDVDENGGIDLLVFCKRSGVLTLAEFVSYKFFEETLCKGQYLVAVIITHIDPPHHTNKWWEEHGGKLVSAIEGNVVGHVCLPPLTTYIPGGNKVDRALVEYRFSIETMLEGIFFQASPLRLRLRLRRFPPEEKTQDRHINNLSDSFGLSKERSEQLAQWLRSERDVSSSQQADSPTPLLTLSASKSRFDDDVWIGERSAYTYNHTM